jgi:DNA-binding XRE family transcriptional regulator
MMNAAWGINDRTDYRACEDQELIDEAKENPTAELAIALGERLEDTLFKFEFEERGRWSMTSEEFKRKRVELNWRQKDAAEALCVTERTVRRYEAGEVDIPEPVAKLFDMVSASALD